MAKKSFFDKLLSATFKTASKVVKEMSKPAPKPKAPGPKEKEFQYYGVFWD